MWGRLQVQGWDWVLQQVMRFAKVLGVEILTTTSSACCGERQSYAPTRNCRSAASSSSSSRQDTTMHIIQMSQEVKRIEGGQEDQGARSSREKRPCWARRLAELPLHISNSNNSRGHRFSSKCKAFSAETLLPYPMTTLRHTSAFHPTTPTIRTTRTTHRIRTPVRPRLLPAPAPAAAASRRARGARALGPSQDRLLLVVVVATEEVAEEAAAAVGCEAV